MSRVAPHCETCREVIPPKLTAPLSPLIGAWGARYRPSAAWSRLDTTSSPPDAARGAGADYESRAATAPTAAEAQRFLREWRRREMLRIAWRDIAGRAGVTETLAALSDLADSCVRAAVLAAQLQLETVFGKPRAANGEGVPLIVLGMGKLGGRELNFSSDIDLVLLFAQAGETDGPRSIANEEYFNRLGREFIRLLDARTEDGFVFRVDMRLRNPWVRARFRVFG